MLGSALGYTWKDEYNKYKNHPPPALFVPDAPFGVFSEKEDLVQKRLVGEENHSQNSKRGQTLW